MIRSRIPQALAVLFVGLGAANAQGPVAPHDTNVPIVDEPAASALGGASKDQQLAAQIVAALNADASLKGSKITVQPENGDHQGIVWITGVVKNQELFKRVSDTVASYADGMGVANVVQVEHVDRYFSTGSPLDFQPSNPSRSW